MALTAPSGNPGKIMIIIIIIIQIMKIITINVYVYVYIYIYMIAARGVDGAERRVAVNYFV